MRIGQLSLSTVWVLRVWAGKGITVTPPVHDYGMARQLALINPTQFDWRLDERTKELGRRGISEARAILRRATPPVAAHFGVDR
ncbi:MAG: hypothetical protein QOF20_2308 [Acidimicrobiaceae bacterium]|nr:hypothetical protein [Acidimicrobiaceae bacterium]MDQ1366017.1 hypothetical protein [Acidimicrobiaceae bacterium]MDQ1369955.1 hypothetical protein [Acidimicrobiaceae bacterium]MDQ1378322.1 hypothetical protein [Acidimicrobiaceae bacterium]MDQ1401675.1 hypothetical protein [Acidimicrobiaceae bacterium]